MAGVFDQLVKQKFEGLILTNNNQAGWPEELSQLNWEGKTPGEFPMENEVFGPSQVFNWSKQSVIDERRAKKNFNRFGPTAENVKSSWITKKVTIQFNQQS